jgi:hypothetical protein
MSAKPTGCRLRAVRTGRTSWTTSALSPAGRSRAPSGGDHHSPIAAVGNRPAHPACRPGETDDQQRAWHAGPGAAYLSARRRLPGATAEECGAVGSAATLVPHSQRTAPSSPARLAIAAAASAQAGLSLYPRLYADSLRAQTAGFRVKVGHNGAARLVTPPQASVRSPNRHFGSIWETFA